MGQLQRHKASWLRGEGARLHYAFTIVSETLKAPVCRVYRLQPPCLASH